MRAVSSLRWGLVTAFVLNCCSTTLVAQAVLNANGPGNTYELINSVLAPGYNVVENPECVHPEFGRHIAEVFDTDLNKFVFEFYSHVTPDNDRCITFDRQRIEIKTYDQSPDTLIGTTGETVTYKWRFKIPVGFKPSSSFTHIHQVKAVGGDDDQPIFTLTPRKGTPNKLELIYVASGASGSVKPVIVNLSLFEGVWVEAIEQIKVGTMGTYSISIHKVSDGSLLMSYSNPNISTLRPDNDFIRPKWGIYRSLNVPGDLRDESIRFSDLSIDEGGAVLPISLLTFKGSLQAGQTLLQWATTNELNSDRFVVERSADGVTFYPLTNIAAAGNSNFRKDYSFRDGQPLPGNNYYRLKLTDRDGRFNYSDIVLLDGAGSKGRIEVYPNPVAHRISLSADGISGEVFIRISNQEGKQVFGQSGTLASLQASINQRLSTWPAGLYYLKMHNKGDSYAVKFLKH